MAQEPAHLEVCSICNLVFDTAKAPKPCTVTFTFHDPKTKHEMTYSITVCSKDCIKTALHRIETMLVYP